MLDSARHTLADHTPQYSAMVPVVAKMALPIGVDALRLGDDPWHKTKSTPSAQNLAQGEHELLDESSEPFISPDQNDLKLASRRVPHEAHQESERYLCRRSFELCCLPRTTFSVPPSAWLRTVHRLVGGRDEHTATCWTAED